MQHRGEPGPTWRERWQQWRRAHRSPSFQVPQTLSRLGRWVAPVGLGMLAGAALVVVAAVVLINSGLPPLGSTLWPSGPTAESVTPAAGNGEAGSPASAGSSSGPIVSPATSVTTATNAGSERGLAATGSEGGRAGRPDEPPAVAAPTPTPPPQPGGSWPWPTEGEVLRGFGWFRHPVYDDWRLHAGIDIRVAAGMAVRAVQDGTVERVYNDPLEALTIQVLTTNGIRLVYGGLAQAAVQVGEKIKAEQTLGRAGAAADPQGRRYVHFGVKMGENPVDPVPWLKPRE